MKNRLLLATLLAATGLFTARCSENPAGPDAGSSPDVAAESPDVAVALPADTGPRPCDPSKCAEGNICVQNKCMLTCGRHTDCPDESYDCREVEGHDVCVPNGMPIGKGQFGSLCGAETATCADGFRCVGGKGDPSSYCAREGCADDSECPGNYACANRDVAASPDAGVDVSYSTIKLCQKRGYCAAASRLVDCNNANAVFAKDKEGLGWCLKGCNPADRYGCGAGSECVAVADAGVGECWPRGMTCKATGKFCGRCSTAGDCGPGGYCYTDKYSKEPFCITPCSTDNECNVGALPTGRVVGQCGDIWDFLCSPQQTGFSLDPNGLSCWFPLCADGFAGCAEADFVDATEPTADRSIAGIYREWDAGYGGDYTPKCLKIRIGQTVTFGGFYSFDELPLTQACGPVYIIGSLESGGSKDIRFNKLGLYGYYESYIGEKDGLKMAGAILVVP
ncbi:MAG: hypothetical protein QM765_23965 [Myxococcales bacterium]